MRRSKYRESALSRRRAKILRMVCFPIYWLSFLVPKSENRIVFASANGKKFSDNSKYLFLIFLDEYKASSEIVWISKEKSIVKRMRNDGYRAEYAYSMKGVIFQLTAKYYFFSYGFLDAESTLLGGAKKICLWHGVPLKKIGYDVDYAGNNIFAVLLKKAINKLFPHTYPMNADVVINPIVEWNEFYKTAFSFSAPRVLNVRQPRVEVLVGRKVPKDKPYRLEIESVENIVRNYDRAILWMPTHRDHNNGFKFEDFFSLFGFDVWELNKLLNKWNAIFIIKPHPLDAESARCSVVDCSDRVVLYSKADPYPLLTKIDLLITDYSSVAFDFAELQRPMIFACFDEDEYYRDIGLYRELSSVFPEVCKFHDWGGVLKDMDSKLGLKRQRYSLVCSKEAATFEVLINS